MDNGVGGGPLPPRNLAPPRSRLSGLACRSVGEEGFEPPQLKQQVYSLPRLSSSGARPFVILAGTPGVNKTSRASPGVWHGTSSEVARNSRAVVPLGITGEGVLWFS